MNDPRRLRMRILALDGGGIKGYLTALWLEELERKLALAEKGNIDEVFDLIAGTSTGSLLACGLRTGKSPGQLAELYLARGKHIFPSRAGRRRSWAKRLFRDGLSQPKYDGKGLDEELGAFFGERTLGELSEGGKTMLVAYDIANRNNEVFKSWYPSHAPLLVRDVCRASCSAPTYFPAKPLTVGRVRMVLVDGGVTANNPSACALAEALRLARAGRAVPGAAAESMAAPREILCVVLDEIVLASFGTGKHTRAYTEEEGREWGALEWALPVIDVFMDGSTDAMQYIVSQILPEANYFRFQTELKKACDDMDNADETNLEALAKVARAYLNRSATQARLDALVAAL